MNNQDTGAKAIEEERMGVQVHNSGRRKNTVSEMRKNIF